MLIEREYSFKPTFCLDRYVLFLFFSIKLHNIEHDTCKHDPKEANTTKIWALLKAIIFVFVDIIAYEDVNVQN